MCRATDSLVLLMVQWLVSDATILEMRGSSKSEDTTTAAKSRYVLIFYAGRMQISFFRGWPSGEVQLH